MADQLMQEALTEAEQYRKQGEELLEKWDRTDIVDGDFGKIYDKNPKKALYGAKILESQEKHLIQVAKRLNEATISSSFQTTPENVLKIIKIGVAQSIRGDLCHEMALQTPDDALYYVERKLATTFSGRGQAGQIINENVNPYYPSEQIVVTCASAGGAVQTGTIPAGNMPVRPNKCFIMLDGAFVGTDDGNGGVTPVATAPYTGAALLSGSIDYTTTGAISLTFNGNVAANVATVIVSWDSEQSSLYGQYGVVTLSTRKQRFAARPEPLGYEYTLMTEVLLGATLGINAEAELIEAVGLEHALAKDYRTFKRLIAVANKNQTYTFDANFAAVGEVSQNAHAQNILSTIDLIGGDVYNSKKRGLINKALVGNRMASYLRKNKAWKESEGGIQEGPHKIGDLGKIEVFLAPVDTAVGLGANDAILTYKNPREVLDTGVVVGVLTELTAKLLYPTMNVVGNVASVESIIVLNDTFVRRLTLTGF